MKTSALEKHGPVNTSAVRASMYSPRMPAAPATPEQTRTRAPHREAIGLNIVLGSRKVRLSRPFHTNAIMRVVPAPSQGSISARRPRSAAAGCRPDRRGRLVALAQADLDPTRRIGAAPLGMGLGPRRRPPGSARRRSVPRPRAGRELGSSGRGSGAGPAGRRGPVPGPRDARAGLRRDRPPPGQVAGLGALQGLRVGLEQATGLGPEPVGLRLEQPVDREGRDGGLGVELASGVGPGEGLGPVRAGGLAGGSAEA